NYRANPYPFRATSHFLYFVGRSIPGAMILFAHGRATLYAEPPDADAALWHGPEPSLDELAADLAVDVRPLSELPGVVRTAAPSGGATLPPEDAASAGELSAILGRPITPSSGDRIEDTTPDPALAEAVIALRLRHDAAAVVQLRAAAAASAA